MNRRERMEAMDRGEDRSDRTAPLASRSGGCDCENLYNVVEECRLKAGYWKAKAAGVAPPGSHSPHPSL